MKFGLFGSALAKRGGPDLDSSQGFREYVDYTVEAEALGYTSIFTVEHHFTGFGQVSATLNLLTWVAARTTTLRLGTAVTVLTWHNPVLLAEQAATLDLVSDGRFDFGIGKGYRHSEFKGFCIPPEEAEARFEESVAVMTRAFASRERFSHRGRFWRFEDIVVEPPPAQRPHPPFWVAAASDASIRKAAARGFNLILDQYASPQAIGERIALYRAERISHGHGFDPMQVVVARQVYVAKDRADAQAALARQAEHTRRTVAVSRALDGKGGSHVLAYADDAGTTEAHALYGTPDEICTKLDAVHKAGAEYVALTIFGGAAQLRRVAREIMPAFATQPGPAAIVLSEPSRV